MNGYFRFCRFIRNYQTTESDHVGKCSKTDVCDSTVHKQSYTLITVFFVLTLAIQEGKARSFAMVQNKGSIKEAGVNKQAVTKPLASSELLITWDR